MFVLSTDARIRTSALESGHVCRVVVDDDLVVLCRDASDDGTPWAPSTSTIPAIERGYGIADLHRRTTALIETASQNAALAREAIHRARASCEASASARARRVHLLPGV